MSILTEFNRVNNNASGLIEISPISQSQKELLREVCGFDLIEITAPVRDLRSYIAKHGKGGVNK